MYTSATKCTQYSIQKQQKVVHNVEYHQHIIVIVEIYVELFFMFS